MLEKKYTIEDVLLNHPIRWNLINYLIEKHDYKSYLEIGVGHPDSCYNKIQCEKKMCVDPLPQIVCDGLMVMTSDQFFQNNNLKFDLIFIDGLHTKEQVIEDIDNSVMCLNDGGTIVCHDLNPRRADEAAISPESASWMGTGYQAWAQLRRRNWHFRMFVVDMDCGCGIIKRCEAEDIVIWDEKPETEIDFKYLEDHRKELLNLKSITASLELL